MERVATIEDFVGNPVGRCHAGPTWVVWCAAPDLCGSVHWGVPSPEDARALCRLLDFIEHRDMATKLDIVIDDGRIERIDAEALVLFSDHVRAKMATWAQRIRRQAVVLPEGLSRLLLAGVGPSFNPPFPLRFVATADEAIAAVERPDARAPLAEVQAIAYHVATVPAIVEQLRVVLRKRLTHARVDAVARLLAMSTRALQRALAEHGTSFGDELRKARVAAAVELLVASEAKVEAIATRVGFGSTSHMSLAFRRELGATPTEIRERQRARTA